MRRSTLGAQLGWAVSAVFFVALVGVQAIHLRSAQSHLQHQLESLAQDAATSLGLSLGALLRGGDPALAETVINPAFDRGHYERIEYVSASGVIQVSKFLAPEQGRYPAWFVRVFPMPSPSAESLVSAGWRQLGKVRVTVHPRFAYEQLWATARDTALYLALIYAAALFALQLFLRSVLRPLVAVEKAAQAISDRNFVELRLKPTSRELGRVVETMNALSRKVSEVIDAETRRARRLQDVVYRDESTGLLNARGFAARFQSLYDTERERFAGVFALMEVAEVEAIRREIGPTRCDELLGSLFRPAGNACAAANGFAGRWTGGSAAMALPGLNTAVARERIAALRAQASAVLEEFGLRRHDRVYFGAVAAVGELGGLEALVRSAEEALLRARETAGDVFVLEGLSSGRGGVAGIDAASVQESLQADRLSILGQKIYRMSDHRAVHVEILARLRNAAGMEMTAAQFMPLVAALGLSEQLDMGVIALVTKAMRSREEPVSVNVSIRSLQRPRFADWTARLLEADRAVARRLVIEIAEHGVVQDEAAVMAFVRALERTGARFAIDHFGVHKDSLALLRRLKPAYIKLAAEHTAGIMNDAGARFFAESVVGAARQLDIPVIAQNVEDEEMYQAIGEIGFSGYQGNLGGRPAPWP